MQYNKKLSIACFIVGFLNIIGMILNILVVGYSIWKIPVVGIGLVILGFYWWNKEWVELK